MSDLVFAIPGTGDLAPYPGLRPFKRLESLLFFGRDRCLDGMAETLQEQHFLAVLGPSGSGKSSLVRSGLFQHLEAGLARKAGSRWTFLDIKHPRCRPYLALARVTLTDEALRSGDLDAEHEDASDTLVEFADDVLEARQAELRRDPMSLVRWWQSRPRHPEENLLLLVDQFEELFGYSTPRERDEIETFVDLLLRTASNAEVPIYVVLTMRSEFLGGCSLFPGFAEQINRSLSLTPRMTRAECELAITGPAYGRADLELDPLLVNALLNDMNSMAAFDSDEAARDKDGDSTDLAAADMRQSDLIARRADQLPLMQHVLNWLWAKARATAGGDGPARLTLEDYLAVGTLRGALTLHANEVLGPDPRDAVLAERIFRAITDQPSVARGSAESSAVRRPRRVEEIAREAGATPEELIPIIDRFRADGVSMLTPDMSEALTPQTEIDISHESIIRQWDRLRGWIRDESDAGRGWQELLRSQNEEGRRGLLRGIDLQDRQEWWKRFTPQAGWAERYGGGFDVAEEFLRKSERAASRRRFALLGGTAAVVVAAVASGLFLIGLNAKIAEAQDSLQKAEVETASAKKQTTDAERKAVAAGLATANAERLTEQANRESAAAKLAAALAKAQANDARALASTAQAQQLATRRETARLRTEADQLGLFMAMSIRGPLDQARNQSSASSKSDMEFADLFLPSIAGTSIDGYVPVATVREELSVNSALGNYDTDAANSSAQALSEIADRASSPKFAAVPLTARDIALGRLATIEGKPQIAETHFRNGLGHNVMAGDYANPQADALIYAELAALAIGADTAPSPKIPTTGRIQVDLGQNAAAVINAEQCVSSLERAANVPKIAEPSSIEDMKKLRSDKARMLTFVTRSKDTALADSLAQFCYSVLAADRSRKNRVPGATWEEVLARIDGMNETGRADVLTLRARVLRQYLRYRAGSDPDRVGSLDRLLQAMIPLDGSLSSTGMIQQSIFTMDGSDGSLFKALSTMEAVNSAVAALESDLIDDTQRLRLLEFAIRAEKFLLDTPPDRRIAPLARADLIEQSAVMGGTMVGLVLDLDPTAISLPATPVSPEEMDLAMQTRSDYSYPNAISGTANTIRQNYNLLTELGIAGPETDSQVFSAERLLGISAKNADYLTSESITAFIAPMVADLCSADDSRQCASLRRVAVEFDNAVKTSLMAAKPVTPAREKLIPGDKFQIAFNGTDFVACSYTLTSVSDMAVYDAMQDASIDAATAADAAADAAAAAVPAAGSDARTYADCSAHQGFVRYARKYGDRYFLFASQANADTFAADPATFLPALQGYDLSALLSASPALRAPGRNFSMLQISGKNYFYDSVLFEPALVTTEMLAWAESVLPEMLLGKTVKPFEGDLPQIESQPSGF